MLESYAKKSSEKIEDTYGFAVPWMLILALILSLINEWCKNRKEFVGACRRPNALQRVALAIRIRREGEIRGRDNIYKVVDGIFETCAECSEEELSAGYEEGKAVFNPIDYNMGA